MPKNYNAADRIRTRESTKLTGVFDPPSSVHGVSPKPVPFDHSGTAA